MTEIYLIRHGQTDSNTKGTYLGWTDIPLNKTGELQSEELSFSKHLNRIDKIFASPLKRTAQTAEIIGEKLKLPVDYDPGLKELNFGIFDDLTYKEIVERYPSQSKAWADDWINYKIDQGESSLEGYRRINKSIERIITENNGKKIAIITHLGSIRMILARYIVGNIEGQWRFDAANCSITKMEIQDDYAVLKFLNRRMGEWTTTV